MADLLSILLIEDESFFQKFYVLKLQERSYLVDLAIDGEDGIQKIKHKKYSCILLDIIMPKKNGFEVLQYAKDAGILLHTPIIMFSTLGQDIDIQRAIALGASGYVNKAFFDFDVLLGKIQSVTKQSVEQ